MYRLLPTTLQPTDIGSFGLMGSTSEPTTTLTFFSVVNCIGIGFQHGTHANWQIVHYSCSCAPTLIDLGPEFPVDAPQNVMTLFLYAAPNAISVWARARERNHARSPDDALPSVYRR